MYGTSLGKVWLDYFTLDLLSCLLFAVIPPQLSLLIAQSIYHYIGAAQAATLQVDNGSTLVYIDPVLCPPLCHHICMFTRDSEHCTASLKITKTFLETLVEFPPPQKASAYIHASYKHVQCCLHCTTYYYYCSIGLM